MDLFDPHNANNIFISNIHTKHVIMNFGLHSYLRKQCIDTEKIEILHVFVVIKLGKLFLKIASYW